MNLVKTLDMHGRVYQYNKYITNFMYLVEEETILRVGVSITKHVDIVNVSYIDFYWLPI